MIKAIKIVGLCSMLLLSAIFAGAAITDVSYKIVYNTTTCQYDIFMTVLAGSASAGLGQSASTAQVSIVVPTGVVVSNIVSNEPKIGARVGTVVTRSGVASTWSNGSTAVNRTNLAGFDVHAFTVNPSLGFYDLLVANDVVKLFSVTIATASCGSGIRLWNNNAIQGTAVTGGDPTSFNFAGDDYNNGIGIGSTTQIYAGNGTSNVTPPPPTVSLSSSQTHTSDGVSSSLTITSTAAAGSACAAPLTYAWTGPNAFTATSQNITIVHPSSAATGTYILTVKDANGCTALASNSVVLPVNLVSFTGMAAQCTASLSWATAKEDNFERFDVEYSADGKGYVTVGQVKSNHAIGGSKYSYKYGQDNGTGYYRLKMVDLDGSATYSKTITVSTDCMVAGIRISPNPTSSYINITGVAAGNEIKVLDMLGQVVTVVRAGSNVVTIDMSLYASGVYAVFITQGQSVVKAGQVVKQ